MSKRILVLEPSGAMQAILTEKVRKTDLELIFDTNGIRLLVTLYNTLPDALLINARNMNPACPEIVRLVKSTARFAEIPVGVFATSDFLFSDEFKASCGADSFITFDPQAIARDIAELVSKKGGKLSQPEKNDIIRTGILQSLFPQIANLNSLPDIAGAFLNLLSACMEVPACAVFLHLDDGAEGFYCAGKTVSADEAKDFLTVCTSDFADAFPNLNLANLQATPLAFSATDSFHTKGIPLSAYQTVPLRDADGNVFGTVHVIKEGAFSTRQLDILSFTAEKAEVLFREAVQMRAKLKFERNIRKAFSRFVPEQIIDELVDGAEQEAKVGVGEKRDVAILFSDIRSFTNISEKNKPEVIVAFLNRYFTIMCTIIKKHGGTIDKFIGDAIMALFGAPVSYEDNAARAVAASTILSMMVLASLGFSSR